MAFPTKDKPQPCRNGCGAQIYLDNTTGKYLPYNLDETPHKCQKAKIDSSELMTLVKGLETRIEALEKRDMDLAGIKRDLDNLGKAVARISIVKADQLEQIDEEEPEIE
jgi:hypothetical protein